MKIWFISDTHNEHAQLVVPEADCVIHCGDEAIEKDALRNAPESRRFFEWFSQLAIPHKIFVPGNHSAAVEQGLVTPDDFPQVTMLMHQQTELAGLRVFGSPYVPRFHDWAFNRKRTQLDRLWSTIPAGVEILITHGPPKGILDLTRELETRQLAQVGCAALRRHVEQRIRPRIHAFGHLHDEREASNFGTFSRGATHFINCSVVNRRCQLKNHGFLVEISPRTADRGKPLSIALVG